MSNQYRFALSKRQRRSSQTGMGIDASETPMGPGPSFRPNTQTGMGINARETPMGPEPSFRSNTQTGMGINARETPMGPEPSFGSSARIGMGINARETPKGPEPSIRSNARVGMGINARETPKGPETKRFDVFGRPIVNMNGVLQTVYNAPGDGPQARMLAGLLTPPRKQSPLQNPFTSNSRRRHKAERKLAVKKSPQLSQKDSDLLDLENFDYEECLSTPQKSAQPTPQQVQSAYKTPGAVLHEIKPVVQKLSYQDRLLQSSSHVKPLNFSTQEVRQTPQEFTQVSQVPERIEVDTEELTQLCSVTKAPMMDQLTYATAKAVRHRKVIEPTIAVKPPVQERPFQYSQESDDKTHFSVPFFMSLLARALVQPGSVVQQDPQLRRKCQRIEREREQIFETHISSISPAAAMTALEKLEQPATTRSINCGAKIVIDLPKHLAMAISVQIIGGTHFNILKQERYVIEEYIDGIDIQVDSSKRNSLSFVCKIALEPREQGRLQYYDCRKIETFFNRHCKQQVSVTHFKPKSFFRTALILADYVAPQVQLWKKVLIQKIKTMTAQWMDSNFDSIMHQAVNDLKMHTGNGPISSYYNNSRHIDETMHTIIQLSMEMVYEEYEKMFQRAKKIHEAQGKMVPELTVEEISNIKEKLASRFATKQDNETMSSLDMLKMRLSQKEGYGTWAPYVFAEQANELMKTEIPALDFFKAPDYNVYMLAMFSIYIAKRVLIPYSQKTTARDHRSLILSGPSGCGKSTVQAISEKLFGAKRIHHVGIGKNMEFQSPDVTTGGMLVRDEFSEYEFLGCTQSPLFKVYADASIPKPMDIKFKAPVNCCQGNPLFINTNEHLYTILRNLYGQNPMETTWESSVLPILTRFTIITHEFIGSWVSNPLSDFAQSLHEELRVSREMKDEKMAYDVKDILAKTVSSMIAFFVIKMKTDIYKEEKRVNPTSSFFENLARPFLVTPFGQAMQRGHFVQDLLSAYSKYDCLDHGTIMENMPALYQSFNTRMLKEQYNFIYEMQSKDPNYRTAVQELLDDCRTPPRGFKNFLTAFELLKTSAEFVSPGSLVFFNEIRCSDSDDSVIEDISEYDVSLPEEISSSSSQSSQNTRKNMSEQYAEIGKNELGYLGKF